VFDPLKMSALVQNYLAKSATKKARNECELFVK